MWENVKRGSGGYLLVFWDGDAHDLLRELAQPHVVSVAQFRTNRLQVQEAGHGLAAKPERLHHFSLIASVPPKADHHIHGITAV